MSLSRLWRVARADPRRIVHADREVVAAVLRREARLALAPVRRRGRTVLVALAGPAGARAEAPYARVLDGRTLNLLVTLPEGVTTAAVLFARRGTAARVPLTLRADGLSGAATVVLGGSAGGVPLTPGRWRVLLELGFRDGRTETVAPRRTDRGRAGADEGPTVAAPPCPDTGVRYQVGSSAAGALVLTVVPPEPAAELTGLSVRPAGVSLRGRLLGVADAAGTTIVFTGPGRREHAVPARVDGAVFEAVVPVASLVDEVTADGARADAARERQWKVWAQVPAAGRLRVARRLTDLRSPQAVHRRPNRMIRLGGRSYALVRPSYAGGGGLTLVCAAGAAFDGTAEGAPT